MGQLLELKQVSKRFNAIEVLTDINLTINEGEFVAIVGFSGSGKSTLINLIAGLLKPDSGQILLNGQVITSPGPDRGVVFQNYSLLPWLTVYGNIHLAVKQVFPEMKEVEQKAWIEKYIAMVNLTHARDKKPYELSGGMRQRVSLARALAMNPSILLLDEPLSALDALTRSALQEELARISREAGKTIVMITNDVDEGLLLADRVIALTPAPAATLGRVFNIDFAKPRHKAQLNADDHYKHVRNSINQYLMELSHQRNRHQTEVYHLPDLAPVVPSLVPAYARIVSMVWK